MLVSLEGGSCYEFLIAVAVAGEVVLFIDVVDMEVDGSVILEPAGEQGLCWCIVSSGVD